MRRLIPTIIGFLMVSFASGAFASDPISGFPPYGSFEDGKFDAINRENLNVNLSIPLTVSLGRGVDLRQTITYDTLIWKKGGYGWNVRHRPRR